MLETLTCRTIQVDRSGIGHNWRTVEAHDLPGKVAEEIDWEIAENNMTTCDCYLATNGLQYRWWN
jgi:hypothetical protein